MFSWKLFHTVEEHRYSLRRWAGEVENQADALCHLWLRHVMPNKLEERMIPQVADIILTACV